MARLREPGIASPMGERAISVVSIVDYQAQAIVDSLTLVGVAAAVIDAGCAVMAANDQFARHLGKRFIVGSLGGRFVDREFAARLKAAAERHREGSGTTESIVLRDEPGSRPLVVHLIPTGGGPATLCPSDAMVLLVGAAARTSMPSTDLLRSLFALTPTEAQVARHLVEGGSISDAASTLGIGEGTVRSHLKNVFAKTGVSRQSDLLRLVIGYAPPQIMSQLETISRPLPNGRGESER